MPRSHKVPTDSLSHAMVKFKGDYQAVADHFGVRREYIWKRVQRDPKLRRVRTAAMGGSGDGVFA